MSEIQHTSLKAELLYLIGRATTPLSCAELYDKCELADDITKVAKALANLQSDGKIVRVEGEGRARYKLAPGVVAPAPAGKMGRSKAVQTADAAGVPPAQPLDIPTLADPGIGLEGAAGKTQRAKADKPKADPVPRAGKMAGGCDEGLADAVILADAIIAKLRKQLSEQAIPSDLLEASPAPTINIHIEQVDIHLGGL